VPEVLAPSHLIEEERLISNEAETAHISAQDIADLGKPVEAGPSQELTEMRRLNWVTVLSGGAKAHGYEPAPFWTREFFPNVTRTKSKAVRLVIREVLK